MLCLVHLCVGLEVQTMRPSSTLNAIIDGI